MQNCSTCDNLSVRKKILVRKKINKYLLELMDAEDAAGIAPVRTHFLAEARRDSCITFGQIRLLDPFVAMECRDRLLRSGDQIFFVYFLVFRLFAAFTNHLSKKFIELKTTTTTGWEIYFVELVVELRKLGDILHDILAHEKWSSHGNVTLGLQDA
jgi:predicted DCC family thiol-disulfide oxidoreductase YuxK